MCVIITWHSVLIYKNKTIRVGDEELLIMRKSGILSSGSFIFHNSTPLSALLCSCHGHLHRERYAYFFWIVEDCSLKHHHGVLPYVLTMFELSGQSIRNQIFWCNSMKPFLCFKISVFLAFFLQGNHLIQHVQWIMQHPILSPLSCMEADLNTVTLDSKTWWDEPTRRYALLVLYQSR